jgi:hypothetical protein
MEEAKASSKEFSDLSSTSTSTREWIPGRVYVRGRLHIGTGENTGSGNQRCCQEYFRRFYCPIPSNYKTSSIRDYLARGGE